MKYLDETYDQLIRRSYGYSEKEQDSHKWNISRALYENNYVQSDGERKIPKKIHQIWLGGRIPDKYRRFTDSWQKYHPDWEYKLWTDSDAEPFGLKNKLLFDKAQNNGHKSDIFRYEILRRYGGLYIDTDFECLKSFDDLCYLDFFAGISYDAKLQLYNGLIACIPDHLVMRCCTDSMIDFYDGHIANDIMNLSGPYYFTKCFFQNIDKDAKGTVIFPTDYFYPLPNNEIYLKNHYIKVRPFSYAIHHWDVAWLKK